MLQIIEFTMVVKKIACKDCGKIFESQISSRYTRKYCDKCSKKRKEDYENLYSVNFEECED